jgi:hypothetical protein
MRYYPGLAAAGAGQNQYRPCNSLNSFFLGGVKVSEDIHITKL